MIEKKTFLPCKQPVPASQKTILHPEFGAICPTLDSFPFLATALPDTQHFFHDYSSAHQQQSLRRMACDV
jgi:hypothetical protein